ncbi:hypothetical protein [Streptomyces atacamensis]|uniref:hypothetical protein n=1 Tax=Streptomyces atacamensis TaxID=531966 RepID=UPI00399CC1A5
MSDTMAMDQAAGQAGQTAAIALQVLVMAAQALREQQEREAARTAAVPTPEATPEAQTAPEAERQPAPDPDRDRYAQMVKDSVQPPAVAESMVTAPQWPQLADELRRLEGAGVDVGQFLRDAAPVISRIDADMRAGAPAPGVTASEAATHPRNPWAPPPGEARPEREGPSFGERIAQWVKKAVEAVKEGWRKFAGRGQSSALDDRSRDLARQGISPQENTRLVVAAREALADESVLGRLVTSREWPSIAGQMRTLQEAGHNPREALAGVPTRIRQAAAAGITLSPAEAARGLLTEQAKTPAPVGPAAAPTTPPAAAPSPSPAAAPATSTRTTGTAAPAAAPTPVPARAAAATAQSTTATPGVTPPPGVKAAPTAPGGGPTTPTRTHGR